ncbi:MAG: hypothetical protein WC742_04985 [Gallionellaceae bacterium]|jgi:hypothetical protein
MNNKIRQLIDQISALEVELNAAIDQQEERLLYQLEGKRVIFEKTLKETHRKVKVGVFRWIRTVRPQNFFTAPFIYGMIFPIVFFDLCVSLYQLICFPIYRIAKVKRADYIVMDHRHLAYLNLFEKIHCMYCSYAVGLLGYANEITARTEQYFCPIKHARKVLATHSRYKHFLEYGEAKDLHIKIEALRSALESEIKSKC